MRNQITMHLWAALRGATAVGIFAVTHSLMASLPAKRRIRSVVGIRRSDALYRFAYCGIAVVSFGAVLRYVWTLPDRSLYRAQGALKTMMIGGQLLCAATLVETNRRNRLGQVSGIRHAYEYLTGQAISPPPIAQHPLSQCECLEDYGGPFRLSSHPNNYFVLLLYWLSPVMTIKWAAIGMVTAVYMVLGSMHEDQRLQHAYGERYACYRSRVPHMFLLPIDTMRRRS